MNDKRLLGFVAAALVLNLATLTFFIIRKSDQNHRPKEPFQIMIDELRLDGEQQNRLHALRRAHRNSVDSLAAIISAERQFLYKKASGETIEQAAQKIGFLQGQIEAVTFDHFEKIRQMCRPEQQTRLDVLLGEMSERVVRTGPRPDGRR